MPATVKAVLLDISGVLYQGDAALAGAHDAISRLRTRSVPFRLVTNTSRQTKQAIQARLSALAFDIALDEIFTGTEAVVDHLATSGLTPYPIVHPALDACFTDLTGPEPDAVVIGDAAERFTYGRLNHAFRLLVDGAPLLAIATNRYFRDTNGLSLDAGPFVAALEYAAGCKAEIFGKPAPGFFRAVLDDLGVVAADAVMIGDDVEADVNGALANGVAAILVRTGKFRPDDISRLAAGGRVADNVLDAVQSLIAP